MTNEEISWIHISDLHFFVEADTEIILKDCIQLSERISPKFMIITGDFRHIKKFKTYEQALILLPKILRIFGLKKKDVFLVPGNHDVSANMDKTYKSLRQRRINQIVKAQNASAVGNYNVYFDFLESGSAPLKSAFTEYCSFVSDFYHDAKLKPDDPRIANPVGVFCSKWKNKINIVQLNTALISDGSHEHKQMCDIIGLYDCPIDTTLPTIIIGHHNLDDLYESHRDRIIRFADSYNVSAYFSGDIHRFKSYDVSLRKPYDTLPCLSCPKTVPQSGDSYSNVGVMYYTWKPDNRVDIQAFEWKVQEAFKPNVDYNFDVDKKKYFKMKTIPSKETVAVPRNDYSTTMKYVDSIACDAYNKGIGDSIANAILLQDEQSNSNHKNPTRNFESIYSKLISSTHNCPLEIRGQPGTGKSTLLSLLYLKLHDNCIFWTYYIDLQCFDEKTDRFTQKQLSEEFAFIDANIEKNNRAMLFIDGLNDYTRLKPQQEQKLREQIVQWQNRKKVQIVCSLGVQDTDHYPPFIHFGVKTPIVSETKINLVPININSVSFGSIIDSVLNFREVYSQHLKTKSEKAKLRNKLVNYCQLIDSEKSTFRTVIFLADRYLSINEDLFNQPVALLLKGYFYSFIPHNKMMKIATGAADFLLCSSNDKLNPYCLKSDAFLDFFFALSYINYLTSRTGEKLSREELIKYDCIFTARINRFVVQLMCVDKQTEEAVLFFIIDNYDNMPVRARNQAIYLLGRFNDSGTKELAEEFLLDHFNRSLNEYSFSDKSNSVVMLLRSMGISLLKLGCKKHEDRFYELLIYDDNMSRINRHFHITYYMNGSYKLTDNDVVDNNLVYDFENIKRTYDFLYHSIEIDESPTHQCVNIITVVDLVLNYIYGSLSERKDASNYFCNFRTLIKKLSVDTSLINPIVKDYVQNLDALLDKDDPYITAFTQIYRLKDQLRKGWLKDGREIDKKQRTESVADHIWACCMLAQMLLPDNIHDSVLIDKNECSPESNYDKQKVISLLLVHDLPESITGDIPSPDKTSQDDVDEQNAITKIGTLSAFPSLSPMRSVFQLWQEYTFFERYDSINARLAHDIDKLEPLVQLYLYRDSLANPNDYAVAQEWVESLKVTTKFGFNLLNLIKSHLINKEAFEKKKADV